MLSVFEAGCCNSVEIVGKKSTEAIFAADATVFGAAVGFAN